MTRQVIFKSTPENWRKEYLGLKKNTVRVCDNKEDARFDVLRAIAEGKISMVRIGLQNTVTEELFYNMISDVTIFLINGKEAFITSWR